jgi:hypothetical protein
MPSFLPSAGRWPPIISELEVDHLFHDEDAAKHPEAADQEE